MKKFLLIVAFILMGTLLFACAKSVNENAGVNSAEEKKAAEKLEKRVETKEIDIERFISDVLLTHYDEQFGYTDNLYKTTGYKILGKDAVDENNLKVYVIANYMEYDMKGDKLENVAGSGVSPLALTINLKGVGSRVDYEVLTDSDMKSEEYNTVFPEDVREKLNPISESDRNEVIKKQEDMLNEFIAEENGEEIEEEEIEEETEEEEEVEE